MTLTDITFKIGGYTKILSGTNTLLILSSSVNLSTTYTTFENAGSDYQVPTGKKLIIMGFRYFKAGNDPNTFSISQCDSVDSASGEVIKIQFRTNGHPESTNLEFPTIDNPTFASSTYVNVKFSDSVGNTDGLIIYGYLEDN